MTGIVGLEVYDCKRKMIHHGGLSLRHQPPQLVSILGATCQVPEAGGIFRAIPVIATPGSKDILALWGHCASRSPAARTGVEFASEQGVFYV